MQALLELEIIRSALLSGEIDDALSRVSRKMIKLEELYSHTKEEKYRVALDLLKRVHGSIVAGTDPKEILECVPALKKAGFVQFGTEEAATYLENLAYYITIMRDRYSISKDNFDSKRCGDL